MFGNIIQLLEFLIGGCRCKSLILVLLYRQVLNTKMLKPYVY